MIFDFKNPICLAACSLSDMGSAPYVGAIFIKSITQNPRAGNEGKIVESVRGGVINRAGLPNSGLRAFCRRDIYEYKQYRDNGVKIIPSIYAETYQEMFELATVMHYEIGHLIDGIEINASCPNATQGPINGVISAIKEVIRETPLIVKLAPDIYRVGEQALLAKLEGADAITLTNSAPSATIVDRQVFCGGLSGEALKPISLRCVYEVRKVVDLPIFACGGIDHIDDVIDYQIAGATYFQVGSAEMLSPGVAKTIVEWLEC
jgi:dihydroorotate dehydrogenase (NAD+) catalytic subunit